MSLNEKIFACIKDYQAKNPVCPKEAEKAIAEIARYLNVSIHHAFPKDFAEMINVRMRLQSTYDEKFYNDSKKPTSPKIALAVEIFGFELERKIFGVYGEVPPQYPSQWKRVWQQATREELAIWNNYKPAIKEAVKLIQKKRSGFSLDGEYLYVLHEPIKARVRLAGDNHNVTVSLEDVNSSMKIIGVVKEGTTINGSVGYPNAATSPCRCWKLQTEAEALSFKDSEQEFREAIKHLQKFDPYFWANEEDENFKIYVCKQDFGTGE